MFDTSNIFLDIEDGDAFEYSIKDIRDILSKFKKHKKASVKDIALLNTISSYLMSSAISKIGEDTSSLFLEYDESDLLDTCTEYRLMCEFLENPDEEINEIIEVSDNNGFLH